MMILRALVISLTLSGAAVAETRFLAALDDVPLAPGLEERADATFAFASAEGRIAEAAASGRTTRTAVNGYYAEALPALGWTLDRADTFVRGRERLTLDYGLGSDGALTVRFRLVARPASLALD